MNEIITAENVCKTFANEGVQLHVLRNVQLSIYEGQFTVVMGPSGSGKSTLLYALSGMDEITSGQVLVKGKPLQNLKDKERSKLRQSMFGFLFQQSQLVPSLTFLENICVPGYLDKKKRGKEVQTNALRLMAVLGIQKLTKRYPHQASGGQQQRCALARALINQPVVLFADEPTGALNSAAGREVLDLLTERKDAGQSIVMVTHDVRAALRGERILYLKDGGIIGELSLPPFTREEEKSRETQVMAWLVGMGW